MRRRRNSIPSYVQDRVGLAEQLSYWSGHRRSNVPEPGGGVQFLTDTSPGKNLTEEQTTASKQSIWRGPYIEFGGDDYYTRSNAILSPDGFFAAGIFRKTATGSNGTFIEHRNAAAGDPRFELWVNRGSNDKSAASINDGTNGDFIDIASPNSGWFVFAGLFDLSLGDMDIWIHDGSSRTTVNGGIAGPGSGAFSVDTQRIGADTDSGGANHMQADVAELVIEEYSTSGSLLMVESEVDDFVDAMAQNLGRLP